MRLSYTLLDVFTETRLAGNPLAVVRGADQLSEKLMQKIAAEFNLPETVFILKPVDDRHAARLRIFTPTVELPFAGHPTVGAAVVLGLTNRSSAVRVEEQVGTITCIFERKDRFSGTARFALPVLPVETGTAPAPAAIAHCLGLDLEQIGHPFHRPARFSAGVPYYLIPVASRDALSRIRPERRGWNEVFSEGSHSVYAFTPMPDGSGFAYAARMFSTGLGIPEDPATGSAAAALIGLVAEHYADGQYELPVSQGSEIGRPSRIEMQLRKLNGKITHAGIGGAAVVTGEGFLELDG